MKTTPQKRLSLISLFGLIALSACEVPSSPNGADTPGNTPTTPSTGTVVPAPPVPYQATPVSLSAVWANDGGDKVARADNRASKTNVQNSVWKNSGVHAFGAKNEVVGFNLVLESNNQASHAVSVSFDHLDGPNGAKIFSKPTGKDGVYNYNDRDIELFFVRYLKIKGLSRLGYEQYDERHIPARLRRPFSGQGAGTGTWTDRPDHDQEYPDILVPIEAVPSFEIAQGQNQSIWTDIYIPKDAVAGVYQGAVTVSEGGTPSYTVPVELTVRNFALPDVPSSKTMLNLGTSDISNRYIGVSEPSAAADIAHLRLVRDRHFQMAHRHKISMIDNNYGTLAGADQPSEEWKPRLDGSLFSSAQGYRGPGANTGNGIFSVGTYGSWGWQSEGASGMQTHANNWASWFAQNASSTEYFLYLTDESSNYTQIQTWANQLLTNTKVGRNLASMATMPLPAAVSQTSALQVVTSTMDVGDTNTWNNALATLRATSSKHFYMYNGKRPASGSFMTDDDGVSLREVPWGQYKKGVDRWFYWESTYYKDSQGGRGQIDVMNEAQTFGGTSSYNSVLGQSAGNYANGDGLLFYPGTDKMFPASSYGLDGPIASLRLKAWRRGIQDVDYLTLAAKINPTRVNAIVNSVVSKVLWENGVADSSDPTWVKCDIGWTTNPDTWEAARAQLADIIEGK